MGPFIEAMEIVLAKHLSPTGVAEATLAVEEEYRRMVAWENGVMLIDGGDTASMSVVEVERGAE
jgi:hypothetical protein